MKCRIFRRKIFSASVISVLIKITIIDCSVITYPITHTNDSSSSQEIDKGFTHDFLRLSSITTGPWLPLLNSEVKVNNTTDHQQQNVPHSPGPGERIHRHTKQQVSVVNGQLLKRNETNSGNFTESSSTDVVEISVAAANSPPVYTSKPQHIYVSSPNKVGLSKLSSLKLVKKKKKVKVVVKKKKKKKKKMIVKKMKKVMMKPKKKKKVVVKVNFGNEKKKEIKITFQEPKKEDNGFYE